MEQEKKKCPYCGEEILAVAKKCKYCGEWLKEDKAENTPKQMIPCPICCEMIEEGRDICPHCHEKLNNSTLAETRPVKIKTQDGRKGDFFKKSKAWNRTIIIAIFIASIIGYCACLYLNGIGDNKSNCDSMNDDTEINKVVNNIDNDNNNNANGIDTKDEVKKAYLGILNKQAALAQGDGGFGYFCTYFLFDITGDGVPELWIESGTCEADHTLAVYTYNNGLAVLDAGEEGNASHSGFYEGDNYILQVCAHMGYQAWSKITYRNGNIESKVVFEEDLAESGKEEYTEPSECAVDSHPVSDTSPITFI